MKSYHKITQILPFIKFNLPFFGAFKIDENMNEFVQNKIFFVLFNES